MNPVLLLHGALGAKEQLLPLQHLLEKAGRVVYTMNFSGHGGEPFAEAFGIETFALDVHRFLEKQKITKATIFGYSMGGYVALWLALHHPEQVDRIVTLGTKFDWSPESAAREIKKMNPEKILEKVPAFARILEHRHAPNHWQEVMAKTAAMMERLGNRPLLIPDNLKQIAHRVDVLLGDADDMADQAYSEQVAQWLRNGRFTSLPQTPHPIEKVDFNNLVKLL